MRLAYLLALTTLAFASGCDQGGATGGEATDDAGTDDAAGPPDLMSPYPAPVPAPPQVMNPGGTLLLTPNFVPIFFSNDDANDKATIKSFISKMAGSDFWTTVTAEYGIGAATASKPIELKEAAMQALSDSDVVTWLTKKLNANDPAFPIPDENTLFIINYPATTSIAQIGMNSTKQSCVDFGGYHGEVQLNANHNDQLVPFAVIPRCDSFNGITGIDAATITISHELVEAATDPLPMSDPAYSFEDPGHFYWALAIGGGEIGDMCTSTPNAFVNVPEFPNMVQRMWSNKAALAGHDPCVPAPAGETYFNTVPELPDVITLFGIDMLGVTIPIGTKKTISLDLFSDGPTSGPWTVKVQEAAMGNTRTLGLKMGTVTSGKNGDKLQLTITAEATGPYGGSLFFITSKLGTRQTYYLGLVGN